MNNLENILPTEKDGSAELYLSKNIMPFGINYLETPKVDKPGEVYTWGWVPQVRIDMNDKTASWPGTTGTGPTAKEDERYGETG